VMIRRAVGAVAPASATTGTRVTDAAKPAASFTDTGLTPGTQYSYALFAHDGTPLYSAAANLTKTTTTVGTAPGPVTGVAGTPASTTVALSWTNPASASLTGVMIRRAAGAVAPASSTTGTLVVDAVAPATTFTDTGLTPGTQYSYALFAHDGTPLYSAAADLTKTTTTAGSGAISGFVTDAGGAHHGLANVTVDVTGYSVADGNGTATTAADGSYTVTGLPAGAYRVSFTAVGAVGGSSDPSGYVAQSYNNRPFSGTPTAVLVTSVGATTSGINAALVSGGALSGTVTDAAGTHHGLAKVEVTVYSLSGTGFGGAVTATNGSYTVTGLPTGTDYQVCFHATGATGGASDALGYLDQCYNNQPSSGTPTPVTVAAGATRPAIDAALVGAGGFSGRVTDAGGTHHGLAGVTVIVNSPSAQGGGSAMTAPDGSYIVTGLAAAADYQVCFYPHGGTGGSSDAFGYLDQCYNNQPTSGTPTPVTVTLGATTTGINSALAFAGAVSGTVTDAGGTHHGLAGIWVNVSSASTGDSGGTTTAADGSYTVTGLPAGTDYQVCFNAKYATGGASDTRGYLGQCYNNQPTSGTPTPVSVTLGATRAAANAALVGAGAISGTVTDAGGNHHGLEDVWVQVSSPSTQTSGVVATAADGSYTVTGLAAGTDYQVCFSATMVTGGSSDALGYVDQCYNNQPLSGTPTLVSVTLGATRAATNADLAAAGTLTGTVTDAAGTHHGLANVWVTVSSASSGDSSGSYTAVDGSYAVAGLAAAADYQVCYHATGATGGASDTLGYADQCYNNQPTTGTPTPVGVTAGATRTGINAALAENP